MNVKNQKYLEMMQDIYDVSAQMGLKSFVWGGFAVDVLYGKFTREHGDLDCFTENLVENINELRERYESLGYSVNYLEDFWMLQIDNGSVHATFNSIKNVDKIAHWYHAGPHGTVFFPYDWLDNEPTMFYGSKVYTFGIKMAYILKTNVKLISAEWRIREKDKADIGVLTQMLDTYGINKDDIKKKVWSHNPYWYAKGYAEYYFPITLI